LNQFVWNADYIDSLALRWYDPDTDASRFPAGSQPLAGGSKERRTAVEEVKSDRGSLHSSGPAATPPDDETLIAPDPGQGSQRIAGFYLKSSNQKRTGKNETHKRDPQA
jgi:hypothetical protein